MPMFVVIGLDYPPHSMANRDAIRTEHRAYVKGKDEMTRLAGAMLDGEGNQCGSLYLFEADDEAQLRAWMKDEPFFSSGNVYKDVIVRRIHIGHSLVPNLDWNA